MTRANNRPSLGPYICAWIEENLVHSEGDWYGKPFCLRPFQKKFIWEAYEIDERGQRQYDRVLLGLPKGNGKTELAAAISACELAGPVVFDGWKSKGKPTATVRLAPDIPMGAASFEQANTVFGAVKTMINEGPLDPFFDCFETEIMPKRGPGRLYRVAAVAGTNDGRRPTCFIADELHEWVQKKERVHLILSNGRAKRQDAWELNISTAGWDLTSLLGRMYRHGIRVQDGDDQDGRFLFTWMQAGSDWDLEDYDERCKAIREANPAADHFLSVEKIAQRFKEIPLYEWQRYYLNQWTDAPERWLPVGTWEACEDRDRVVADDAMIMLGFDGSYAGDSTAIVGSTMEPNPHIFVVEAWEKEDSPDPNWRVPIQDVEETIRQSCIRWNVQSVACDPHRWQRSIAILAEEGLPMVEWPSHTPSRMVPACAGFSDAVINSQLTHDGDTRLAKHISNCQLKIDSRGPRITKDHQTSERHIDLAVAGVIAHDMCSRNKGFVSIYANPETAAV